jgi:hypothetical protein
VTRSGPALRAALIPVALAAVLLAPLACSPEAARGRDGGAGADPGNKNLVMRPATDPVPADTTLWPGRAVTPVERLARGEMAPPAGASPPVRVRTPESRPR